MSEVDRKIAQLEWEIEGLKGEMGRSPLRIEPPGPVLLANVSEFYLFEALSVTESNGIYTCNTQTAFGLFGAPTAEVLNLFESQTVEEDYEPALAAGDRMMAFQTSNAAGTPHWVGVPLTPAVRMARLVAPPDASQEVLCNLVSCEGVERMSGLGSGITVHFKITRDKELNQWNIPNSSPRLVEGEYIFVENLRGVWWKAQTSQCAKSCICNYS
ncbi:MAG: hypothetical protein PHY02_06290 [Phycisphaerae bacterium]|nr:hypothetical protein [Phycisphaerae bacterium]